jgi:undecaprenyl diphosphate synthase
LSRDVLKHIGIIMDGNNRWAKREGRQGIAGHKAGVERIRDVLAAARARGVSTLTLFAFSSENWRRPPVEVEALMGLFFTYLKKEARELKDEGVNLRVIGNRARFNKTLLAAIDEAESIASGGSDTLVIAADYGGRWDIAQAANKAQAAMGWGEIPNADLTEEIIDRYLSTASLPALDLLIRTGGELRISNFLLWQAAYAELYFSPLLWPEFDASALNAAVDDFYQRQRRFGYTSEQIDAMGNGGPHA